MNKKLKNNAKIDSEDFFKLMNNTVFRKTLAAGVHNLI